MQSDHQSGIILSDDTDTYWPVVKPLCCLPPKVFVEQFLSVYNSVVLI